MHITAGKGSCLAYIEMEGAYDVLPVENASNNEDRAIWIHASNVVWVDPAGISTLANGPKAAVLWGNPLDDQPRGTLVKLLAGFAGAMRSHGSTFHAVVIEGRQQYREPDKNDVTDLEPGSYFSSQRESVHQVSCEVAEDCAPQGRSAGSFDLSPVRSK